MRKEGVRNLNLAVVDDEKKYIDTMIEYCREFGIEKHLCFEAFGFKSGSEFLKTFEKGRYSIIFMDIYMTDMSGIETARRLREQDTECILIFLTSSSEFMPDAFSCHAFEYIIKPFTRERVFQVLSDASKILPSVARYLKIISGRKTVSVALSDIMSVVSDGHYLEISLENGTSLRSRMTTAKFLDMVDLDPRFLSVNKGIILNADYVRDIENQCCTLLNGTKFPIRVRDRLQVEQAIQDYNFAKLRNMQRHTADSR